MDPTKGIAEQRLELALAVADGTPLDWAALDSAARTDEDRIFLQQLRAIAGVPPLSPAATSLHESILQGAPPAGPDSDAPGVQWGPLRIIEKVGNGTFGDVYRAWDTRLDREVALKLLRRREEADASATVVDEGRLMARVRHPNVVTVYGAERIDERTGIWMELVRGRTLAREVGADGPVSAEDAARIGIEVCRALTAVHAAGLVHRDLKAQNVMREPDGRIVLGDFGTGLELQDDAGIEPQMAGTPLYLAPEILAGRPPSPATDVYSLGVLLYFLVSGAFPFQGRTLKELRRAHDDGRRIPLLEARPDLPPAFVQLVEALIEPGPDRRYGTATSAQAALEGWIASEAEGRPARRSVGAWLVMAGIAVVVLGALAALLPGLRERTGSPSGAGFAGAAGPISRQILDAPCSGRPSADGQWIACVEHMAHYRNRGGGPAPPPVVLFNPTTGETRIVREAGERERLTSATISPDGGRIAFTVLAMPPKLPPELRVIDSAGTSERLVTEFSADVRNAGIREWSSVDGQILTRLLRGSSPQIAALVAPESGAVTTLFEFEAPPQDFARSPDGQRLAFDVLQAADGPERDIRVCDLSTQACETAVAHPAIDVSPAWAPDGRLLFTSDRAGTMGLWAVELDGLLPLGSPELIRDTGRASLSINGFGPDDVLYYTLRVGEFDVYEASLDTSGRDMAPVRLSPRAVDVNRSPVWSPDGQSIAYVSRRGPFTERGGMRIVIQSTADGREREFRYDLPPNMNRLAWAPDGRALALRSRLNGTFGVHLLDPGTGSVTRTLRRTDPPVATEDQLSDIAWVDGQTIVFAGPDGVGLFDISSGAERRMWDAPPDILVHGMALSPDRAWVAVSASDGPASRFTWFAVLIVPTSGGSPRELLRAARPEVVRVHAWTNDGDVLATRWDQSKPYETHRRQLWQIPFDAGPASPLPLALAGLDEVRPHPDGRRIAFTAGGSWNEFWMLTFPR